MPPSEVSSLVASLAPYFHKRQLRGGEVLVGAGEEVDELYLVEEVRVAYIYSWLNTFNRCWPL